MTLRRILAIVATAIVIGALAFAAIAYEPEIAPIQPPDPAAFAPALVARGAALAAIGDCAVCHTASGGQPYAGGRPIATPFGTIYATNITPDPATGLGTWSIAAFRRAMRRGIARSGRHLYPAFPYEYFAHVTDGDLDALYAFLMTRTPVAATAPANDLIPPLGFRPLMAGWNLLFLTDRPFTPSPNQTAEWNRGAYLVAGLAHCGACHTPRNVAGAEESGRAFAGGMAEGWYAPPLTAANPAPERWTEDQIETYLRAGIETHHNAAAGPMGPVSHGLAEAPAEDVHAIAIVIAAQMAQQPPRKPVDHADPAAASHQAGAALFAGACASCHAPGAPMVQAARPDLSLVSGLQEDVPANTIEIMLQGLQPPAAPGGPYMPAFADTLTDPQIADIAAYLRARYSDQPPWPTLERAVQSARREGGSP